MAKSLPLNALNAFEVAARHESFSKAAEELNVTPAAISQQIRMLEVLLDVQLFHRLNRGLTLTPAGKSGLSKLQDGFRHINDAFGVDSVDGTRGVRFNRVSLALDAAVEAQGVVLSLEQLASNDLRKVV